MTAILPAPVPIGPAGGARLRRCRHTRASCLGALALGHAHDRATCLLALPFGLVWWPWLGLQGVAVAALAFLVGGLWLSPDLDTLSRPSARWGPLMLLWWPYRHLLSHRSLFSHGPLIGSILRLLYLLALVLGLCFVAQPLGLPSPGFLLGQLRARVQAQPLTVAAALSGLEASAWLHLIQDGDPLPRVPRPLRPLLSRRRRRRRR